MTTTTRQSYLETQILTATPQRLRLMLLDAAIRSAGDGISAWHGGENERAYEAVSHCRDIVLELLLSIDQTISPMNRQLAGVYGFLYRTLSLAIMQRDSALLTEAVRVLQEERTTWQRVCEEHPEAPAGWKRPRTSGVIVDSDGPAVPTPHIDPYSMASSPKRSADRDAGFSIDA